MIRRTARSSIDDQASTTSTTSTAMESPDNDSAFESDDVSLMSSESSASSGSGMIQASRWTRQTDPGIPPEADVRKFFVNIYCADGLTKEAILIDSQMSVSTVIWLMSERSHVQCHSKWALIELIPELNIERCLEDHEKLFDTLTQWKPNCENRIIFAQRQEKYDVFMRPERYLPNSDVTINPTEESRHDALTSFFSGDLCKSSQADGLLWTKSEGKKSWKKHLFVLRDGNLFQATKCKKGTTQDFVLVANIKFCRVYWGVNWKKKLKAPNDFSFALTPPKLHQQDKNTPCMKYLCAEDEITRVKWTTLFRIAQNGRQLVENFCSLSGKANFLPPRESKEPKQVLTITNGTNSHGWQQNGGHTNGSNGWQQDGNLCGSEQIMIRSDSELSSCPSDVDSTASSSSVSASATSTLNGENGFDTDHHEGGTIRRKPVGATATVISNILAQASSNGPEQLSATPQPALPMTASLQHVTSHIDAQPRQLSDVPQQFTESDLSLNSLPPPPEELRNLHRLHSLSVGSCEHHLQSPPPPPPEPSSTQPIREELYPCGVPRVIFHPGNPGTSTSEGPNQMDLLKKIPNNPPPLPFTAPSVCQEDPVLDLKSSLKVTLITPSQCSPAQSVTQPAQPRRRRITFNEVVHSVDDDDETELFQLKGDDTTPTQEDLKDNYSERDVSNWVLESLKHCRVSDAASSENGQVAVPIIAHELRPKIYNGRSVPNCFPPGADESLRPTQFISTLLHQQQQQQCGLGRRVGPPPPPKRSQHTQLTSPT